MKTKFYIVSEEEIEKLVDRCVAVAVNSIWCKLTVLIKNFFKSRKSIEEIHPGSSFMIENVPKKYLNKPIKIWVEEG